MSVETARELYVQNAFASGTISLSESGQRMKITVVPSSVHFALRLAEESLVSLRTMRKTNLSALDAHNAWIITGELMNVPTAEHQCALIVRAYGSILPITRTIRFSAKSARKTASGF